MHNERPPLVKRVDQRRCQSCIHRPPGVLSIGQCSEESPADLPPKLRSAEHELAPELPGLTRRELFVLEDHGDLVEELLLPRLLDLKKVLLEIVGNTNTQDRGVGAQLELLWIEPRAQPPVHLFRKCESTRSGVLRLEPVLVVVEVESRHGEHAPEDVSDGCRAPIIVIDGGDQPERVAHHHKEGDLAGARILQGHDTPLPVTRRDRHLTIGPALVQYPSA